MIPYKLRPYKKADFEFVYQIKKQAYQSYVEKFWKVWNEEQQRCFFMDFIEKVHDSLLIIEFNDTPIGIYHGSMIDRDTYEIGNIILTPEYQRQGIGKDILLNIINGYQKLKIRLQVFKGNPAINLYRQLNFTVIDETKTHYIMECI